MQKFKYKFERILNVNKIILKQEQAEFGKRKQEYEDNLSILEKIDSDISLLEANFKEMQKKTFNSLQMQQSYKEIDYKKEQRKKIEKNVINSRNKIEEQLEIVQESMKEVKKYEILKEKDFEKYKKELIKQEDLENNEFSSFKHFSNK